MKVTYTGLYCADCGTLQREDHKGEHCQRCSSITFAALAPTYDWLLTERDVDILRTQRIDPS